MAERRRDGKSSDARPVPTGADPMLEVAVGLVLRFRRFAADAAGLLLLAAAVMTLVALLGFTGGSLLTPWAGFLRRWLGWGSVSVVLTLAALGAALVSPRFRSNGRTPWGRILALEFAVFAILALLSIGGGASLERAEFGQDGGLIGWGLAEFVTLLLGTFWRTPLLVLALFASLMSGFGLWPPLSEWLERRLAGQSDLPEEETPLQASAGISVAPVSGRASNPVRDAPKTRPRPERLPREFQKKFKVEKEAAPAGEPPPRDELLPPLDLLVMEKGIRPDERTINLTAGLIEKTMAEFGIPAKVVGFQVGPTITQFALEPGFVERPNADGEMARHKVRVSQISALSRDLALALSAERLRIQAPVPGRPFVGIEVPNMKSSTVRLRALLETEAFYKISSPLAVAMGRDVSGAPVVADLASMPHLLIAGATGSGKSVCIAAITTCLVVNNSPEELRLVMVDPKMVELVRFNGLPHLYGRVETELERMLGVLKWTVMEMDRRYKLLEKLKARDIGSYNRKILRRKEGEPLPRIVLLIDELADLMMTAADQTEHMLVRLAQMARATGIHLVLATQRPSTDVVTGLIKANFPARLSFAVASGIDSRVVLDMPGAESLLGRGDMLFLPPEAGKPTRAQGVMVSDQEVERVINFWRENWIEVPATDAPWEHVLLEEAQERERDDLVEQAVELVRESGRASASMLQRRLRIGYPRAARLIDQLEDLGVVGPSVGPGKERDVLVEEE